VAVSAPVQVLAPFSSDLFPAGTYDSASTFAHVTGRLYQIHTFNVGGVVTGVKIGGSGGPSATAIDALVFVGDGADDEGAAWYWKATSTGSSVLTITHDTAAYEINAFVVECDSQHATTPIVGGGSTGKTGTNSASVGVTQADMVSTSDNRRVVFLGSRPDAGSVSSNPSWTEIIDATATGFFTILNYCAHAQSNTDAAITKNNTGDSVAIAFEIAVAEAGDVSYTLTGQGLGSANSAGLLGAIAAYALVGESLGAALSQGTPGIGLALAGQGLGGEVSAGVPTSAGAYSVTGSVAGAAEIAGAPVAGAAYSVTGAGISAAMGWSAPVAASSSTLLGASIGAVGSAGSPDYSAPGEADLTGQWLGVAFGAGVPVAVVSYALAGAGVGVTPSAGALTAAPSYALAGAALGSTFAHGSPLVSLAHSVAGAVLGAAGSYGALSTPGGTTLSGQGLTVGLSAGQPIPRIDFSISGQGIGAQGAAGLLTSAVSASLVGLTCSSAPSGGSLGGALAATLTGASCSVATAHGVPVAGEAEDVTLTLVGLGLGVQCSAGILGRVTADTTITQRRGTVRIRRVRGTVPRGRFRRGRVSRH
jgi:hypothetical protein